MRRLIPFLLPALLLAQGPSPAGHWEGSIQVPDPGLAIRIDLWTDGGALQGAIEIPAQGLKEMALGDLRSEGGRLQFTLPKVPGLPTFDGTFTAAGGRVEGTFTQGGHAFPFVLDRKGEVAPALIAAMKAAAAPAKSDRELAFAGFNGAPLKGSVRSAEGSPWFAVMVAGSGPTDRDWSSPLLRDPANNAPLNSHTGRDFAAWLQAQGLGSLRYDKRFIGSKDPKLDISLDAQVGDIKAALAAARLLPEAKGKKLLLIGHSEGALLSLLAAGNAEALLLLALPGRSMAQTIHAQIARQLPADSAAENLAYLDSVFDAIRKDKAAPEPGKQVFPNLARLGKSFMVPESLGFVKATLDLDPWVLLARCPVPVAIVWGGRDIQTWRPDTIPEGYKGAVIELPEANHLLRVERRPKELLSGADALSAYTDGTPQADLAPLAAWIKGLK